jgi:lipid II:glycine glycyltransferase (peptidoglycan interpeptide bridge formation enzyme)
MQNIRKAIREGIIIKRYYDLSMYYELFSMTFERRNLKTPVSSSFFYKIFEFLKATDSGDMLIAETPSGEVACAEILTWDNKRAYDWSSASHTELRNSGASSLLQYEACNYLKKRGFKEFNVMRANTPSFVQFITGFNPMLMPYYGVEKSNLKFNIAKFIRNARS